MESIVGPSGDSNRNPQKMSPREVLQDLFTHCINAKDINPLTALCIYIYAYFLNAFPPTKFVLFLPVSQVRISAHAHSLELVTCRHFVSVLDAILYK